MSFSTRLRLRRAWPPAALLAVVALSAAAFHSPTDDDVVRRLVLSVQRFYAAALPEKAYLHLDKPWYTAGETIWLKAYVVDAERHQPDTLSKVLHVELLNANSQLVARRNLRLEAGLAPGDVALPDTLSPGNYTLRAYTGWMRNAGPTFFYSRQVAIWPAAPVETPDSKPAAVRARAAAARQLAQSVATPPDVQFFPEGGNLVAGLENTVAFKVTDFAAHGIDVEGKVFDGDNKLVAAFGSSHLGMGTFVLTPAAGQRYHAVLAPAAVPLTVPLPAVQASGYTLHVVTLTNDYLVAIRQQGGSGGPVLVLGQVRGTAAYVGRGQVSGTETFTARIPKSKFPAGIVHFTLFDGQGAPLAERLAFAQTDPGLRVTLTPDRPSYGSRQPVRVRVAVANAAGEPVAANLSLAVTDAGVAEAEANAETIASNLLLTSDLAGYVETPGYYFQNPTPETAQHLDALLLTQGWRRFAWTNVLSNKAPVQNFGVERSVSVLGQILQRNGKPVPGGKLNFLQTAPTKLFMATTADEEGRFLFNGIGGCDTIHVTLQSRTGKDGRNAELHLDPGPPVLRRPMFPLPMQVPGSLADALARSQQQRTIERKFRLDTTKTILLGGVMVKGAKAVVSDPRRLYPSTGATVLKMDDYPGSGSNTVLQMLQGRVAGVTVTGTGENTNVLIRGVTSFAGSSSPLFLLDGVPVDVSALAYFPATDAESIEVLKGGQAAIYGSRGSNGVIAVYSRRRSPNYKPSSAPAPGVAVLHLPAYYCGREFYVPRYDAPKTNREFPDARRSTLYWNPTVQTDAAGQAEVRFFTSDAKGAFQLRTEGLSRGGQPAQGQGTLRVE
ncbi:TonB-dependent receptor plug domain-containing protein [Hymenobacter siberiensis]|uniref:TonB-dependent receptor plug domain-containing protein n=1 Tax=Hymenobacter siberiensis TaxID=2848396 RepID=UPI001C1E140A|nr:TonB-dependent receptor plug domain-containing protein [Hymenobacter siberiensis]MBU6119432.1 TonB-dependent receptor plug domain-containing protein [Hymenobacter siberiensis]